MQKQCFKCKELKDVSNFRTVKKRNKMALYSYCIPCESKISNTYYHKNPEKYIKRTRAFQLKNIDNFHKTAKLRRLKLKEDAINKYGGSCQCCGENELVFLTIDHLENNGNVHRREIGKSNMYVWLRNNNYPKGYQTLCWNCNSAKHILGKCPHQNR